MDQERQIRFLYPPFFLLASLLWGLYLDPNRKLSDILPVATSSIGPDELVGLLAGGSIVIVASGFLIGAISVLSLRLLSFIVRRRHYEAGVSTETLKRIWGKLQTTEPFSPDRALYVVATFDHEVVPKTIHEWIGRRWSAFNVSAHSCTALALSLIVGSRLSIMVGTEWFFTTMIIFVLLTINAFYAWRDTMAMIDFQSHRSFKHAKTDSNS